MQKELPVTERAFSLQRNRGNVLDPRAVDHEVEVEVEVEVCEDVQIGQVGDDSQAPDLVLRG